MMIQRSGKSAEKKTKGFTGLYFMDEMTFFAIYPTENGPVIYIGMDVWSDEEDVDLFYQIAKFYRDEEYYKKYIKETRR